ncbi:MAG: hypothetical protein ACFCVC_12395 [Acidimicrobiia bacterium]
MTIDDKPPSSPNATPGSTAVARSQDDRRTTRMFEVSTIISGIRCTIAYLILPFFAPFARMAPSVGPIVGLTIGAVALVANVYSIRRFWRSRHKWRRPVIAIHVGVIGLLINLAITDVRALV